MSLQLLGQDEPEVPPQTRASLFTSLPMEDQTIHDSNSSNSRLAYSRDDVKESGKYPVYEIGPATSGKNEAELHVGKCSLILAYAVRSV